MTHQQLPHGDSSSISFRMPAEWEKHQGCIILFPHNPGTFHNLIPAQKEFLQVAISIAKSEHVYLLVRNEQERSKLMMTANNDDLSNISIHICESDDTWARDTAPTFVFQETRIEGAGKQTQLVGIDWDFNAYGGPEEGCYWPCERDRRIASRVCEIVGVEARKVPIVLEGGSIHTDGEGTLLTTKECLLNKNRNPGMSQEDIENYLKQNLGCNKIIWLDHGLAYDDDTNGHIDNWACFVKPRHIALAWTDDKERDPENYARCRSSMAILQSERDALGRSFEIHKMYLPTPTFYTEEQVVSLQAASTGDIDVASRCTGDRIACSYINFYLGNSCLVCPQFGDSRADERAIKTLESIFPTKEVVAVYSKQIAIGGGNIHCITQQIPSPLS